MDALKYLTYARAMSDHIVDAAGLLCPLPVLKARKRLLSMTSGQELILYADDPAAIVDVPHFCIEAGYTLIRSDISEGIQSYVIRKP